MAEKKDDIDVAKASGGNSKLLIIIIAVLVLALIGLGVLFLMGGDKEAATEDSQTSEAAKIKAAPIYYSVEAPFIINFSNQSNGAVRYLQVKLKVMARDQAVISALELNLPAIQHEVLLLLYEQNYEELSTAGTKNLQEKVLTKINDVLKTELPQGELEAVYFTSFLMQ